MKIDKDIDLNTFSKLVYPAYVGSEELLKNYIINKTSGYDIPKYPEKLPGTIWAITTFFNPAKYKNKSENYKTFREESKRQGLKLLTVELSFSETDDYEIQEEDADILVRIKGEEKNILWQKEAMLNIALKNLPDDCDKVIWIDCDLVFHNDNWVTETAELLEKYIVVQPFSSAVRLPENLRSSKLIKNINFGNHDDEMVHGFARGVATLGREVLLRYNYVTGGHTGLVWSIRRSAIEELGFYPTSINGAGDSMMSLCFYGFDWAMKHPLLPIRLLDSVKEWRKEIYQKVKGSVSFTNGIIDHLWHGTIQDRVFEQRDKILVEHDFDPCNDVSISENGLLEWTTEKTQLIYDITNYFHRRKEEG